MYLKIFCLNVRERAAAVDRIHPVYLFIFVCHKTCLLNVHDSCCDDTC